MRPWETQRLEDEVERIGLRGLPPDELHRALSERLRRVMPFDAACWHGLDPNTLLLTTANPEELLQGGYLTAETEPIAARAVLSSEYLREDVNDFATLARRRTPVGILSETTRGRPERSARYAEFLEPSGTPHELRAALVTRGRAWGCVVFHRADASGGFTPTEARVVARLSRRLAEAVRRSVRTDAARRGDSGMSAPGMLVLGATDEVELITPDAEQLLEPMRAAERRPRRVPVPVISLATEARRVGRSGRAAEPLHVPTTSGWLTFHASLPEGGTSGRVAIVVQRASDLEVAPLRLETFGLTTREREVATLVATGLDTAGIAERLFLSPWTVQDHLKAIFEKTETRSRRELRARIFFSDYVPAIASARPLTASGTPVGLRDR